MPTLKVAKVSQGLGHPARGARRPHPRRHAACASTPAATSRAGPPPMPRRSAASTSPSPRWRCAPLGVTDLAGFPCFEAPAAGRARGRRRRCSARLGAIDAAGALTDVGRRLLRFPLHPRQARLHRRGREPGRRRARARRWRRCWASATFASRRARASGPAARGPDVHARAVAICSSCSSASSAASRAARAARASTPGAVSAVERVQRAARRALVDANRRRGAAHAARARDGAAALRARRLPGPRGEAPPPEGARAGASPPAAPPRSTPAPSCTTPS